MAHYRKKPIVIEAVQVTTDFIQAEVAATLPQWVLSALVTNRVLIKEKQFDVQTTEGVMSGNYGDWLIKGVEGELYPCKASVFEATYEPVADISSKIEEAKQTALEKADKLVDVGQTAFSGVASGVSNLFNKLKS